MTKIRIIQKLSDKIININQAKQALNKTERTIYRYLAKYKLNGPPGLRHGLLNKPSNNNCDNNKFHNLYKFVSQKRFSGFGPTLLSEKIEEHFGFSVNIETLRLKMIKRGIRVSKPKKKIINRIKRNRRESYGMLVQFDGSYHDWLENGDTKCLLACIDDATSSIDKLLFCESESVESIIKFWSDYFIKVGKPQCIYLDSHSTYKVNHPCDQFDKEMKTRFQRAMEGLGIIIIYSKSPQGKGRIERSFKTHQDRLVKELRFAGIKDYETAQKFVDNIYITKHNSKFSIKPLKSGNFHVPITANEINNIEWLFAKKDVRTIKNDGTISFNKKIFQIHKNQIIRSKHINVIQSIYGNIRLYSGNILLSYS